MILSKDNVLDFYSEFISKAKECCSSAKYDQSIKFLTAACHTAYTFYLNFYDEEIEQTLQSLASHLDRKQTKTTSHSQYDKRVVMYDTFSQDNQGLTIQYLSALINCGYDILYITEFDLNDPRSKEIKHILESYPNAIAKAVPSDLIGMSKAQYIYDEICAYNPLKLFMHIHPSAVAAVIAFYALPKEIIRYQINLTDHAYWVGAGCIDYSFEFRDYGASLSIKYRKIPRDRILLLPYYPIMKTAEFKGFPNEAEGKVKIFSGSSFYKIIDEKDSFFKLNKAILDANPEAVTLFAGGGDMSIIEDLIKKYHLEGRFIPIGQRNDIFECYKHSDIYLSTFPLFGGLMGQYAAYARLPILALEKKTGGMVEEVICQKKQEKITLPEIEDVTAEATRLIKDSEYRKQRGEAMRACVINKEEFEKSFKQSIASNQSQYAFKFEPNFELHYRDINDKLKLINKNKDYHMFLFNRFGSRLLLSHPTIWIEGFKARLKNSRFGKLIK